MSQFNSVQLPPMDRHNTLLLSRTHPDNWINPIPAPKYNLVAIGGGTAGLVSAAGAAALGARTAIIEKNLMGGDCLNVGCVPSKCLIRSSRSIADVRNASSYGVDVPTGVQADFPSVMERMRHLRAEISKHDSVQRFKGLGVDVFLGEARFVGKNTVQVNNHTLHFSRAVIATGGRASVPCIEGLEEAGYLTNETLFSLTKLPIRLGVIGAGPIGCEMAQAFHRLGSKVFLFESQDRILNRDDKDCAFKIQEQLCREGINLSLNSGVIRVKEKSGIKVIHVERQGQNDQVEVDGILVAAGRSPRVEGLGLEAAGVDYDVHHGILVNDRLQTSNKKVYAAGDICSQFKFTHAADALARIVIQNALFRGKKKASTLTIPWCTYTDPELAHVGLTQRDAYSRKIAFDVFVRDFSHVDRAITDGEKDGMVKILVEKGSDRILGGSVVARHASEMINEITLAMVGGIGLKTLAQVIHPYPTQAEAIKQVADTYNRKRITPLIMNLLSRWFSWTR